MPLNPNQQQFIQVYRSTRPRNATKAYQQVYGAMPERRAQASASRLLSNAMINAAISAADEQDLKDLALTPALILQELARIGLSDISQLYTPDGSLRPLSSLPADLAAIISSVEVTSTTDDDGTVHTTRKIRLWSKTEALKMLAQYLHLLTERVQLDISGNVVHTWAEHVRAAQARVEAARNGHQLTAQP